MTVKQTAIITIASSEDREPREVTRFGAGMIETALYEFLDDAEHYEFSEDAPGWGSTDWVFPAQAYDAAFLLTLNDPAFRAAKRSGLVQVNLSEKLDGDAEDAIELVAFERSGILKFAQRYVFE